MLFPGAAIEPVNAAELSCVKRPAAASERHAMTTSLRMKLCAHRGGRFLAPDPPQDGDQKRESCHADEEAAHHAGVRIKEDVTGDRHVEGDASGLSGEANRPRAPDGIRTAI